MAKKLYIEPKVLIEKVVPENEMVTISQETEELGVIKEAEGGEPEDAHIDNIDNVW